MADTLYAKAFPELRELTLYVNANAIPQADIQEIHKDSGYNVWFLIFWWDPVAIGSLPPDGKGIKDADGT